MSGWKDSRVQYLGVYLCLICSALIVFILELSLQLFGVIGFQWEANEFCKQILGFVFSVKSSSSFCVHDRRCM